MPQTRRYIFFMLIFTFLLVLLSSLSKLCLWALALENGQRKIKGE